MEKEILSNLVNKGLTIEEISLIVGKSKTSVRYWLEKHSLKTKRSENKKEIPTGVKICNRCEIEKNVDEFYRRRGGYELLPYCKSCTKEQTIERQRNFKIKCVEYKGGKCERCGYANCIGALEFHHLDPNKKDFTIAHVRLTKFDEKITIELDKCVLVCSNCHRELHNQCV